MRRTTAVLVLVGLFAVPSGGAQAQDAFGGAVMGGAIGGYAGGINSGRVVGAVSGMITGATAGAIIGSDVQKRPGYYWREGDCYRRVRGGDVRVTRRYCY